MKCPKCKYISFDYNQVCPVCEKDLMGVRSVLNLPSLKPNPPFLLGLLTGEVDQGEFDLEVGAVSDITGIEGEDLEIHLETEIPEEPIEPPGERIARVYPQEDDSRAHPGPGQTPYDEAEMVTSKIDRKKKGHFRGSGGF
jgi:hypothetical protein